MAIREQALGVLNGRGWLLQVLYEVLGLRLSAHSVAAAVALLGVLRLHKLLAERSICVALNNRLEPGGRVIHDSLSFLPELLCFFLRHLD